MAAIRHAGNPQISDQISRHWEACHETALARAGRAAHGLGRAARRGELPRFAGATGWLNSPPLTPADLRGKVALTGHGTVAKQRLYLLICQPGSVTGHTSEVTPLDPGVQAYSFTFG